MKRNLDKNMSCHFWTPLRKQEKNSKVPLMSYLQKTGSKRRRTVRRHENATKFTDSRENT